MWWKGCDLSETTVNPLFEAQSSGGGARGGMKGMENGHQIILKFHICTCKYTLCIGYKYYLCIIKHNVYNSFH